MESLIENVQPLPVIQALTAEERETIIRLSDADDFVLVDTTRRVDISAFKKKEDAELVAEGTFGSTAWATFKIPKARWSSARGIKSKPRTYTEEQKKEMAARLASYRR